MKARDLWGLSFRRALLWVLPPVTQREFSQRGAKGKKTLGAQVEEEEVTL